MNDIENFGKHVFRVFGIKTLHHLYYEREKRSPDKKMSFADVLDKNKIRESYPFQPRRYYICYRLKGFVNTVLGNIRIVCV